MKTCWKTLPTFRQIGDILMKKYYRARSVAAKSSPRSDREVQTRRLDHQKKISLVLMKGKKPSKKMPKKSELVFLQMSPNYCEKDSTTGSLGTVGRICNRTSIGKYNIYLKSIYVNANIWFSIFFYRSIFLDFLRYLLTNREVLLTAC